MVLTTTVVAAAATTTDPDAAAAQTAGDAALEQLVAVLYVVPTIAPPELAILVPYKQRLEFTEQVPAPSSIELTPDAIAAVPMATSVSELAVA